MATKLDQSDLVTFKELLLSNSIQIDTAVKLLIEEGVISKEKFITKLKEV